MKVVGLMTVRNEDWVLGLNLRAATFIVEDMIVLDHASIAGSVSSRWERILVWQ